MEWCSGSENCKHAWDYGLHTVTDILRETAKIKGINRSKKVIQYDLQNNFITEWESATEAGRQLKINNKNICTCCRGKKKTAGGYIWRYKEEKQHDGL